MQPSRWEWKGSQRRTAEPPSSVVWGPLLPPCWGWPRCYIRKR